MALPMTGPVAGQPVEAVVRLKRLLCQQFVDNGPQFLRIFPAPNCAS